MAVTDPEWFQFLTGQKIEEFVADTLDSYLEKFKCKTASSMLNEEIHGFVRVKDI